MSHVCLTRAQLLELMNLGSAPTSQLGASMRALEKLSHCGECWQPVEELREEGLHVSLASRSPLAALFRRLVRTEASRVSHLMALAKVRTAPLGLYRLLLEEIAEVLPLCGLGSGQQYFLLFEVLLGKIVAADIHVHDLQTLAACYAAVFFERQGWKEHADGKQRQAEHHLLRGTGSKHLKATYFACLAERQHTRGEHGDALALMQLSIELAVDIPARRAELLMFCAALHLEVPGDHDSQKLRCAWEQLLEAKQLAEVHASQLLETIQRQLVLVEQALACMMEMMEMMEG